MTVPHADLRALLYGDAPLGTWASDGQGNRAAFAKAAARLQQGDRSGTIAALRRVLTASGLESRHYLQAWHELRRLGVAPPHDDAKHLYGVVVDVPVDQGLDTVAAYEDLTARYFNFSGAAIVWDARAPDIDARIQVVLAAARSVLNDIGPWEGDRPALPEGQARISFLTPSGLHFGQAPLDVLLSAPGAAPILRAAMELMQALIARASERSSGSA